MESIVTPGTTFTLPTTKDDGSVVLNVNWVVFVQSSNGSQSTPVAESLHPGGWMVYLSADLTQITVTMPMGPMPGLYSAHQNMPNNTAQSYGAAFRVPPVIPAPTLTATATLIGNVPTIILSGQ